MTRDLLIRGMIAGIVAAFIVTMFARLVAEPQVDLAIAFEASRDQAAHRHAGHAMAMPAAPEPELVSRDTQKGVGLLTATALYGAAVGGIFSLVFAVIYGRVGTLGPRSLSLLMAIGAFIAIALVPAIKYPATPPAVGQHETVVFRTLTYFAMIALSVVAMVLAIKVGRAFANKAGPFNAMLIAAGAYVAIVIAVQFALPAINEVPADFPAVVLWRFRIASLGVQAILWVVIGIGFGATADRVLRKRLSSR
ncbi:CbtA family protein [Sphingomonas montanisoli]|uniref:CbtA family protein n=1 Tax=Sphingomonas montanisoli TaxID=2606412 RepID=A0A5D9C6Z8_9SPHN|nr:CbtA family protein [Sphingomonas montanisoli]TZG27233.1 CbtA family protein [Sphingomonas montanisoli]